MYIEVIITLAIVSAAFYMLYKSIRKSASGKCTSCKDNSAGGTGCPGCCSDIKK